MLIQKADVFHVRLPLEGKSRDPASFGRSAGSHDIVLLRLETDGGLIGWGEGFSFQGAEALKSALETLILPLLVGRPVDHQSALLQDLKSRLHGFGRTGPVAYGIAAVDIALWDLLGKAAQMPLYRLLGGSTRTHLQCHASVMRSDGPTSSARSVELALKRGFKALKIHEIDLNIAHTARDIIGYEIPLMIDAECSKSPKEALELCAGLAELEPFWLEEPVSPPENCEGISEVRANGGIPIAAGENAGSLYDFKHLLGAEAIDYATPSVGKIGLTETLDVMALCRAQNVATYLNCPYLGPALLASLHLIAARAEDSWVEHLFIDPEASLYGTSARPFNGSIMLPQGPGLGLEPDLSVIERYKSA